MISIWALWRLGTKHRPQNSFKSFIQSWIQKEARYLGSSELSVRNMMDRINICDTLLKRNEIKPFLKRMITSDEKWITYDNPTRKRSWIKKEEKAQAIAKPGLTRKKVILCVWKRMSYLVVNDSLPVPLCCSIKQLIPNFTVNNCRDYNKQLRGSGQN